MQAKDLIVTGDVKILGELATQDGIVSVQGHTHDYASSSHTHPYLSTLGGGLSGHLYLTGANANSSTASTSQIVFGTSSNNHVAISSNDNALVINPDTSSTTNQIVLYLDKASDFPKGITSGAQIQASTFYATSDARLKENFKEYTSDISILDLPVYTFDFIDGAKNQLGCKAQDLQKICPEIVVENENGYLSIQESKIVYLLIEEIKQLKDEISKLKNEK